MEILTPLVSVIIPAYQSAETLPRAIKSVLNQNYKNFEIIVVDNGSTDNTQIIVNSLMELDSRIHLVSLKTNQRPAGGRNAGVTASAGEYIAFLDADDEWLQTKVENQLFAFELPEIGVVLTDGFIINASSGTKELYSTNYHTYFQRMVPESYADQINLYKLSGPVREILYEKCVVNLSSVLLRKDLFIKVGGFDQNLFGPEDLDLWIKLAKITNYAYLAVPMVNRYISNDNFSAMGEKWLLNLLDYHKRCSVSADYADMPILIKRNLEKYYRYLIIFYGSNHQIKKALKLCIESLHFGFFPKVILYTFFTLLGKRLFAASIALKLKIT